jgi:hypothetical protein
MTIFQLLVYSCITANGLDGELIAKTCRWDARALYVTTERCEEAGAKAFMSEIFGDSMNIDNLGRPQIRRVEKHKCEKVTVYD